MEYEIYNSYFIINLYSVFSNIPTLQQICKVSVLCKEHPLFLREIQGHLLRYAYDFYDTEICCMTFSMRYRKFPLFFLKLPSDCHSLTTIQLGYIISGQNAYSSVTTRFDSLLSHNTQKVGKLQVQSIYIFIFIYYRKVA